MRRVAVIGAGPSGLASIKSCKEYGLDVVCLERSNSLGGLWYYREKVEHGVGSVARMTIYNSSKEASAYSDFPAPDDFPNYMHRSYVVSDDALASFVFTFSL